MVVGSVNIYVNIFESGLHPIWNACMVLLSVILVGLCSALWKTRPSIGNGRGTPQNEDAWDNARGMGL